MFKLLAIVVTGLLLFVADKKDVQEVAGQIKAKILASDAVKGVQQDPKENTKQRAEEPSDSSKSGKENHRDLLQTTLHRIDESTVRAKALRPEVEEIRTEIEQLQNRARSGEIDVGDGLDRTHTLQTHLRDRIVQAEAELLTLRNDVQNGVLPKFRAVAGSLRELAQLDGINAVRKERLLRLFREADEKVRHLEAQVEVLKSSLARIQRSRAEIEAMLTDSELERLVIDSAGSLADSLAALNVELGRLADLVDPQP